MSAHTSVIMIKLHLSYNEHVVLVHCVSQPSPFLAAADVLGHFRTRFITDVDANKIVFDLLQKDIIAGGNHKEISRTTDGEEQNKYLHEHLRKTCDEEALMIVCDIIISVKGHQRMKKLGKEMKRMLQGKCCRRLHSHVHMLI